MAPKKSKPPVKLLPAPSLHSGAKVYSKSQWLKFRRFATPMHLLFILAAAYLLLSAAFTASFFLGRSVNFSFAEQNCFKSPILLPNLVSKHQGETFNATPNKSISIAGYPLYSHSTCITPTKAPVANSAEEITFSPLGMSFIKKKIKVSTDKLPAVGFENILNDLVSTHEPLVFPLSSGDRVFDYRVRIKDKTLACSKEQARIVCNVQDLGLEQSAGYTLVMERLFKGEVQSTVFAQKISTVGAVLVSLSSPKKGQTVFNVPKVIRLTVNKPIKNFDGITLHRVVNKKRLPIAVTATAKNRTLTIKLAKPLTRQASFELQVTSISSDDGGHLPETFVLPFVTSGGPKVSGINIGTYKVPVSTSVTLSFDTPVSGSQKLSQFIRLEIGGTAKAATISRNGRSVIIQPAEPLPRCTGFVVKVLDGLENQYGIAGDSAWQYSSRTICQSVFSIGASIEGRSILAYRFDKGGNNSVVYVGGTHGNEQSSVYTLNSWIDYLERNFDSIPKHRAIIVIPNINPDGFARGQRTNARNVDLNRNFPANNWKKGVVMPGGSYNPNGGGSAPLSEPESKALANYVTSLGPRLVLTYHAAAGVVIPNDSGDSDPLAKVYDQKSNLYYQPNSQTTTIFQYDTTGSFEEWLHDKRGKAAILVELWTTGSNEFSGNQNAMWHMTQLP